VKNRAVIFLLVIISIFSIGCSNKYTVESLDVPIEENMKLESTKEGETEGKTVELSAYVVENGALDSFLFEYEKKLNDKGWKTTNNLKPNGLVVEKNNKKVTILAYEREGNLMVDVIPTPKEKE
jgi:hypothetical protein